eukprot:TRINITY_DN1107_c0_g1_i7.p1 TRINITY_DN1107_c0_g1~~TRINITY_DN1107_c0_g1_i7.p1  ORF type:complete len:513 (-),score=95.53 TRINITY_DN1107_c0_g1_i7:25-1563(-)
MVDISYLIAAVHTGFGCILIAASVLGGLSLDPAFWFYSIHGILFVVFGGLEIHGLRRGSDTLVKMRKYSRWCIVSTVLSLAFAIAVALLSFFKAIGNTNHCDERLWECCILIPAITLASFTSSILGVRFFAPAGSLTESILTIGADERQGLLNTPSSPGATHMLPTSNSIDIMEAVNLTPPTGSPVGSPPPALPDEPQYIAQIKFNRKPERGVQYMIESGLTTGNPRDIAEFLYHADNLNFEKLGDYLSRPDNTEILRCYADLFSFFDMDFDVAIREFLSKFRLPGEAQKIDRIMEQFAQRYSTCNPAIFPSPDPAYVLAFSIIMLNTDAHNPSIKRRMTVQEFISNNRGISNGQDLPREFLEKLYNNITSKEIKFLASGFFSRTVKSGWLKKQGKNNRWQRRLFVVSNNFLVYFNSPEDKDPRSLVPLEGVSVERSQTDLNAFVVFDPSTPFLKSVKIVPGSSPAEGKHEKFLLQAENPQEAELWVDTIRSNTISNPALQLINMKRGKMEK